MLTLPRGSPRAWHVARSLAHDPLSLSDTPLQRSRWVGDRVSYVKDYDGGTHMECYVHPTIPYLAQADMYAKQRDWVVNRIADTSCSTRVYPGLPDAIFEDGSALRHIDIPGGL